MAERMLPWCLHAAFWVPLALCTWLALAPSPPDTVFRVSDVLLHGFAFTYLTFASGLAYPSARPLALAAWMLAYGLLIEVVQSVEPARSAELKDLLVDFAGILVGLILLRVLGEWSRSTVRALLRVSLPRR